MKLIVAAAAAAIAFAQGLAGTAAADAGIRQEKVQFPKGASSAVIKGQIKGDATVDYVVRAAAGQTLSVKLQKSNAQNYFNVMPPGSTGSAMFVGDSGANYSGMLPTDGDYVVRVYLMRPAARRGESSNYTLTIDVTGSFASARLRILLPKGVTRVKSVIGPDGAKAFELTTIERSKYVEIELEDLPLGEIRLAY